MEIRSLHHVAVTLCKGIVYITFARQPEQAVVEDIMSIADYPALRLHTVSRGLYVVYVLHPYETSIVAKDVITGLSKHGLVVKQFTTDVELSHGKPIIKSTK